MEYKTCIEAIKSLNTSTSNTCKNKADCKCTHDFTPCDWVGNEMHYACLKNTPSTPAPQKVYWKTNAGGNSRITMEETLKTPK